MNEIKTKFSRGLAEVTHSSKRKLGGKVREAGFRWFGHETDAEGSLWRSINVAEHCPLKIIQHKCFLSVVQRKRKPQ